MNLIVRLLKLLQLQNDNGCNDDSHNRIANRQKAVQLNAYKVIRIRHRVADNEKCQWPDNYL